MSKVQKAIFHIVTRDKFTAAYINFMKRYMTEFKHIFLTYSFSGTAADMNLIDNDDVIILDTRKDGIFSHRIRSIMSRCDKIIVSGVFCDWEGFYSKKLLNKMYLQFWGADMDIRSNNMTFFNPLKYLKKYARKRLIKYSAAVINLIEGDYKVFVNKNKIEKIHFVAPMPPDPLKKMNIEMYRNRKKVDNITRIILGNSATRTNMHFEALDMLEHFKCEPIEIYCPLSYGADKNYREEVVNYGRAIFGEKFIPVTEFMDYYRYMEFLSNCDIGIFNNNRQQGLGNILPLIGMGKKMFINEASSTYEDLINKGYIISKSKELKDMSFDELRDFSNDKVTNNIKQFDEGSKIETKCQMWSNVFNYER